jgi:hypothetical protein
MNTFSRVAVFATPFLCGASSPCVLESAAFAAQLPTLEEAIAANRDLFAEAALLQPNGPSYEFFKPLIPALHYVNADFRHYPIVLSAPMAQRKARLVSNGSAINARANTRAWNEIGTPVLLRVGNDEMPFGEYLQRLDGPHLAEGYLPIVQLKFHHGDGAYSQETFASTLAPYDSNAVVLSRFAYKTGDDPERPGSGRMVVRLDSHENVRVNQNRLLNEKGEILLWYDEHWKWDPARHLLEARFPNGASACLAAPTVPMAAETQSPIEKGGFDAQRRHCSDTWNSILQAGMNIQVPEPYVNNAWRTMVLANLSLINGARMHYSAGNQYDKLYEHEGSDAALALMLFGYEDQMRRLIVPLLDFTRKGLEYHQAGHKLDDVCRLYWQTRDADFIRSLRPKWQQELDRLAEHRSSSNGLYPREQYCGDIPTPVVSMNSNAKGWRALRDTAALLDALGDKAAAEKIRQLAVQFRKDIMAALEKSTRTDEIPTFIPNALFGEEQPYSSITESRMGSYYNLMANTIVGTEIFGSNSQLETGMLRYLQERGGFFMGLIRARSWPSFWIGTANLNPLYGLRYDQTLLRRDEPDLALVSFYGMLAAGLTPETFVGGEGNSIQPVDQWGRLFYCPPNSAGNAFWLQTFRRLLVQDWDTDEDGEPDTLRLMFGTSRRWLDDGREIKVERAPTAFGRVSVTMKSQLHSGNVIAEVSLPTRNPPRQTLLRARVPDGWNVTGAKSASTNLTVDEKGTVDISNLKNPIRIEFRVEKRDQ